MIKKELILSFTALFYSTLPLAQNADVTANMPAWAISGLGSNINQTFIFTDMFKLSYSRQGMFTYEDAENLLNEEFSNFNSVELSYDDFKSIAPDVAHKVEDTFRQGKKMVVLNVYPTKSVFEHQPANSDPCPPCTEQRKRLSSLKSDKIGIINVELVMQNKKG